MRCKQRCCAKTIFLQVHNRETVASNIGKRVPSNLVAPPTDKNNSDGVATHKIDLLKV